jgi:hypothetical protein
VVLIPHFVDDLHEKVSPFARFKKPCRYSSSRDFLNPLSAKCWKLLTMPSQRGLS